MVVITSREFRQNLFRIIVKQKRNIFYMGWKMGKIEDGPFHVCAIFLKLKDQK